MVNSGQLGDRLYGAVVNVLLINVKWRQYSFAFST